ncbi:hypothetical protein Aperf_G00000008474 [Anoplocephala perfoliata]
MAFAAIFDVVKNILEESLPEKAHPILSLAKSDQEKKLKRKADNYSDDENGSYYSFSKSERAAWIRQPIAAGGVRRPTVVNGAQINKSSGPEFECEKARERRLKRQATQGIVALFNAVRQHQSTVEKQLGASAPLLLQKEKVITGYTASDFLDRLSAGLPGSTSKVSKSDAPDNEPAAKRRNLYPGTTSSVKTEKHYITMSFLKNDSIFDLTGLSLGDFTLSHDSESAPTLKPSADSEETKNADSRENTAPVQLTENKLKTGEGSTEANQLGLAKLAIRHDIMSHISGIISDLVAIDMKYSELTSITNPKVESRPQAPSGDLVSRSCNTPLETLHNFTIAELRTQLESLKSFISDLDAKYFEVARAAQEKIKNLEQANSNLTAEVERLRKVY